MNAIETIRADVSDSTRRSATHALQAFEQFRNGREIDAPLLAGFREHIVNRRLAASYKRLILAHTKAALRRLKRLGGVTLDADVIGELLASPTVPTKAPVVLSLAEIKALWLACEGVETGRTVRLLMLTGSRREEIVSLRAGALRENALIIIDHKRSVERAWPLALLGGHPVKPPYRWERKEWDVIRENAGQPGRRAKDLRSTLATWLISSGKYPPFVTARLCGHTIAVAEAAYWGSPILDIEGAHPLQWWGLA